MSTESVRTRWETLSEHLARRAESMRIPNAVALELSLRYSSLGAAERADIDPVLSEWILSDDAGRRFDALTIVAENHVTAAAPALAALATRLRADTDPSAGFENDRVTGILSALNAGGRS
jgi:hypothetical protein